MGGYRPRSGSPFNSKDHPAVIDLFDDTFTVGTILGQSTSTALWSDGTAAPTDIQVSTLGGSKVIANGTTSGSKWAAASFTPTAVSGTLTGALTPLLSGSASKTLDFWVIDNESDFNEVARLTIAMPAVFPFTGVGTITLSDETGTIDSGTLAMAGNTLRPFELVYGPTLLSFSMGTFTLSGPPTAPTAAPNVAAIEVDLQGGLPLQMGFNVASLTLTAAKL